MDEPSEVVEAGGPRERPVRARLLPWLLLVVAFGTAITDVMTPRDLSLGEEEAVWNADPNVLSFKLMRLGNILILVVSAAAIVRSVIRRGFPRAGLSVWLGYLVFVATCFLLPGVAGRVPGFDERMLYPPLAFTALYFAPPVTTERLVTLCRVVLGTAVYGSLVAALVYPSQALAGNYVGFFSWLDFRLYGIGGGATSLGEQSSAFLAIELVSPSRSRWHWLHVGAGATALFLTQAKTSWGFALAVVAYLLLRRLARRLAAYWSHVGTSARALGAMVASGAALALAWLAAYQVSALDLGSLRGAENLTNLTGRTYVWAISLNTWLDDPIFGYGLGLWQGEYSERYAPMFPHAHNQFIQSLASAGVVGLAGLLVYLWTAHRAARRALPTTPVPLVLFYSVLTMCLTSVPLRGLYLLEPLVLVHLLLFAALVNTEKLERAAAAPAGA